MDETKVTVTESAPTSQSVMGLSLAWKSCDYGALSR